MLRIAMAHRFLSRCSDLLMPIQSTSGTKFVKLLRCNATQSQKFFSSRASVYPGTNDVPTKKGISEVVLYEERFVSRHIGPSDEDIKVMLSVCNSKSLEELIDKTIPQSIRLKHDLNLTEALSERELINQLRRTMSKNQVWRSYIGMGYYNSSTPTPIQRNIFENPGWITSYTPYQPEISQGRLECLLNFQTMITDLTGMDVANASLLDEGTAAAEAVALACRKNNRKRFYIDSKCHPQTIAVVETRARGVGIETSVVDLGNADLSEQDVAGILVQYPDSEGSIRTDMEEVIKRAKQSKTLVVVAADLLALSILKPPGDFGADVVIGSAQRFGVPLGYGGPHPAYFAVKQEYLRSMPGRIVGVAKDMHDRPAYRLTLQTREQHIRRDKATSNICTAQALLANMAAMYAVYHGPKGVRGTGERVHRQTLALIDGLVETGHKVMNTGCVFDTIKVQLAGDGEKAKAICLKQVKERADSLQINLRYYQDGCVGVALDETVTMNDLNEILSIFGGTRTAVDLISKPGPHSHAYSILENDAMRRSTSYLQHPVFNTYHSETNLVRYMKLLENKDISLVHSMISLGSCTMKLNGTTELIPCSWPEVNQLHPFAPPEQATGYADLLRQLEADLCEISGYDTVSLQPNSGAQGEYAGLRAISAYLASKDQVHRKVCLIPTSAHGTNPASAQMAGMEVRPVRVNNRSGAIDMTDLASQVAKFGNRLAAIIVTYPSTSGVFDVEIREICDMVHAAGGQVYLDGANMNAQVGLCRPGDYGGDVSHLNLHKTFCIPHGGGGPGMGPIGVKAHLAPFLPSHPILNPAAVTGTKGAGITSFGPVASAPFGSASILPISWAYIRLMGAKGLRQASLIAVLNANYMMRRLENHYHVKFTNANGFCAHEFIIDCSEFKKAGIEVVDIAKRLMDYGFHSPTMSFPVATGLMIEPTESEDKAECDRLCDSLIQIREEIRKIETGQFHPEVNPLKMAPHTQEVVTSDSWERPYSRAIAAYPAPWQHRSVSSKVWPSVGRIDDKYGDQHLFCTCPSVEEVARASEAIFERGLANQKERAK